VAKQGEQGGAEKEGLHAGKLGTGQAVAVCHQHGDEPPCDIYPGLRALAGWRDPATQNGTLRDAKWELVQALRIQ
jgi:hypothetical protein